MKEDCESMASIKERWQALPKKWKLMIIALPVIVILGGAGGATAALEHSKENPSSCGNCHLIQSHVDSYYLSDFLVNTHAQANPPIKCKDCHEATLMQLTKEGIAFVIGNYETPLEGKMSVQKSCTGCHPVEEVNETVRNNPKFAEDTSRSYHLGIPEGGAQALECRDPDASAVQCQWCHQSHKAPVNYCATCHSTRLIAPDK
jgi:hypothetical protein